MKIDMIKAYIIFEEWTKQFDLTQPPIIRKIEHTYRVAQIAKEIGKELGIKSDLPEFLGLVHDIGRLVQWKQFEDFSDKIADHAALSVSALLGVDMNGEGLFIYQLAPGLSMENFDIIITAVSQHSRNKPNIADPVCLQYAQLLRDADIMDNLLYNLNLDDSSRLANLLKVNGFDVADLADSELSDDVFVQFAANKAVDNGTIKTPADRVVAWGGYYFNLSLDKSKEKALPKLINVFLNLDRFRNPATVEKIKRLRDSVK